MKLRKIATLIAAGLVAGSAYAQNNEAPVSKPNIVVIMGDDIGWSNIGAYNQGMMATRTPNLDKLAAEGFKTLKGGRWPSTP